MATRTLPRRHTHGASCVEACPCHFLYGAHPDTCFGDAHHTAPERKVHASPAQPSDPFAGVDEAYGYVGSDEGLATYRRPSGKLDGYRTIPAPPEDDREF